MPWVPGSTPPSFDKQPVRDHLEALGWDKTPPAPALGADVTSVELDPRRVGAARRNLRRLGLTTEHVTADLTGPVFDSCSKTPTMVAG